MSAGVEHTAGSERDDYDAFVLSHIEEKEPCFLLYRLDSTNSAGSNYLFISFVLCCCLLLSLFGGRLSNTNCQVFA